MDWWWPVVVLLAHLGPGEDDRWARVLTGLDLQRAAAFRHDDPDTLRDVYASDAAAEDDLELLGAYRKRGGQLEGALLLVERAEVQRMTDDQVRLRIVDRLGPTRVRWEDGSSTRLPRDSSSERVVVLTLTDDGWRISEARRPAPR